MLQRILLAAGPLAMCAALVAAAACGGDDDDDDVSTSCTCQCACCVAMGNCDNPSQLSVASSSECDQSCSDRCGGNYSSSYDCS